MNNVPPRRYNIAEIIRFLLTGVISNGSGYVFFLIAVYVFGIGHKTAATVLFLIVLAINLTVNRSWTFKSQIPYSKILLRFIVIYTFGYFINMLLLGLFVDCLDYPVGWSQFIAIGFLTIYYFFMNKFYIYKCIR